MSEVHICDSCETELSDGEWYAFDGHTFCADCLDDETFICSHCGERIWNDDNAGSDSFPLPLCIMLFSAGDEPRMNLVLYRLQC